MTSQYRYIAFSQIHGGSLTYADTMEGARDLAVERFALDSADFLEVIDCGDHGRITWIDMVTLPNARTRFPSVFRGTGYDAAPAEG